MKRFSLSSRVSIMRPESLNSWEQNGAPSPRVYLHSRLRLLTFSEADTVVMYLYQRVSYTASHVYRVDSTIRVRGLESRAPLITDYMYTEYIGEGSREYTHGRLMKKENERLSSRDRIARRESSRDFRTREKVAHLYTHSSRTRYTRCRKTPSGEINIGATRLRTIARIRRRTRDERRRGGQTR